ncbi:MAG: DUF4198 domain-containing protein, partial [Acidobacteria bacterium]|nr:DUF4198 domain-containing protein [Acidobacteriota bacterium]
MKLARLHVAFLALPLLGHDLYLMPQRFRPAAGAMVTIAFHNGDDFPDPDRAPKPENLLDVSLHGAKESTPMRNLRTEGKVLLGDVTVAAGSSLLSARTRPNLIELQPGKFEEYLRHEGLTHVLRWRAEHHEGETAGRERYSKYVKSLVVAGAPTGFYRHPVGYPIEIMPEADPALLKAGGELPIQVIFRGKPAADLQIEMAWLPPNGKATRQAAGRTDGEGRLRI